MNKRGIYFSLGIFILVLSLCLFFVGVYAQNNSTSFTLSSSSSTDVVFNQDSLKGGPDQLKEDTTTYLKQEWTKILEKNKFGQVLLRIGEVFETFNPFFKLFVGVEYSFSWYFLFAFLIWIGFFLFFISLGKGIFPGKLIIVVALSFIITSLIGMVGTIREILDATSNFINDPVVVWLAWISLIIAIILFWKFGEVISKFIEKYREDMEKEKVKGDRKIIGASAEGLRKGFEEHSNGGGI